MSDEERTQETSDGRDGAASHVPEPEPEQAEPAADDAAAEEIARLQEEVSRNRELYLRKLADFENYRKRQERDMAEFRRLANADLIRDLLPVLDNLERALSVPGVDGSALHSGVELVVRQFKDVLGRFGLVEEDPAGQPFDPTRHEAIARQETSDVEDHTVVQVMQKGYLLGERLLRPALVVVAVRGEDADEAEGGGGA